MRKKIQYALLLGLLLSVLMGCGKSEHYALGYTEPLTGTAQEIQKETGAVAAVPVTDDRSALMLLDQGQLQLGIVDAVLAGKAARGADPFGAKIENLTTLVQFYPATLQMVAVGSGEEFAVRKQKKLVVIGTPEDDVARTVEPVLRNLGISNPQNVNVVYLEAEEAVKNIKERKVDALLTLAPMPDAAIQKTLRDGCALVNLTGRLISDLPENDVAWTIATIPETVYDTPKDTNTVTMCSVLLASKDVPADIAQKITAEFAKRHGGRMMPDIASAQPAFPYNEGARKALDEIAAKAK